MPSPGRWRADELTKPSSSGHGCFSTSRWIADIGSIGQTPVTSRRSRNEHQHPQAEPGFGQRSVARGGRPSAAAAPANAATSTCNGEPATIVGTNSHDDIEGTSGRDVIVGLAGNDEIDGNGGNDVICGDAGADELDGDSGDDWLNGGSGNDEIDGDAGNDELIGGSGHDAIEGGRGDDQLLGEAGTTFSKVAPVRTRLTAARTTTKTFQGSASDPVDDAWERQYQGGDD